MNETEAGNGASQKCGCSPLSGHDTTTLDDRARKLLKGLVDSHPTPMRHERICKLLDAFQVTYIVMGLIVTIVLCYLLLST